MSTVRIWTTSSGWPGAAIACLSSTPASPRNRPCAASASICAVPWTRCGCSTSIPDKVTDVILTHLHYDHAGNLDRFPVGAVSRAGSRDGIRHRAAACAITFCAKPSTWRTRSRWSEKCTSGSAVFHDGDSEVVPGLTLHRVGGHTAGLADCARRGPSAAGWCWPPMRRTYTRTSSTIGPFRSSTAWPKCWKAIKTLYSLADSPAHIVPGHDPLVMKYYPAVATRPGRNRGSAGCSTLALSLARDWYPNRFGPGEITNGSVERRLCRRRTDGRPMCRRSIEAGNSLTIFDKATQR